MWLLTNSPESGRRVDTFQISASAEWPAIAASTVREEDARLRAPSSLLPSPKVVAKVTKQWTLIPVFCTFVTARTKTNLQTVLVLERVVLDLKP
jgi:hypothetical protein